jgi:hypothetical protein
MSRRVSVSKFGNEESNTVQGGSVERGIGETLELAPQGLARAVSFSYSYTVNPAAVSAAAPYSVTALATSGVGATSASIMPAAVSATPSAAPSWVSQIKTASIAADMRAAIGNGQATYSGLLTLLNNVAGQLSSSKSTLTSAQLTDLRTIAANLNNGLTTPAYLTSIMKSVVLNNSANCYWTGGAASTTILGNLGTSSDAARLSGLIGKWFLGTDLPSSSVIAGGSRFSVTYSNSAKPLYGASGPSWTDVNQGRIGDCYLESCLAEVAYKNPSMITSMITDNGNGSYGIRFTINGAAQYVTVNSYLANDGTVFNSGVNIWASLIEKGYAQIQASGVCTGNAIDYGNSWSTIGNGGRPEWALAEVTGATEITDYVLSQQTGVARTFNATHSVISSQSGLSASAIQSALITDLAQGDDLILASWTNAKDSQGKTTLVSGHAFSIYGFNTATGMFQIRNPWGAQAGQYWATTFEVSLATLMAAKDTITVDNAGTSLVAAMSYAAPNAAPTLSSQTASQSWKLGSAGGFTLAANTFKDPEGQALAYKATLADGSALPSWLTFNAATQTFSGTAPGYAGALSLKVTATDTGGLSASETFSLNMSAAAPKLSAQTAAQKWSGNQKVNFTLAANTFTDPQGQKLTYAATQSNGSALPSWLSFNASTRTFSGTAPSSASSLGIRVTATDQSGLSATETFGVTVAAAATSLANAIAGAAGSQGSAIASLIKPVQGQSANLFSPAA